MKTKAEPRDLLARGSQVAPPVLASQPQLTDAMSPDQALRLIVATCLDHILPNAAAVADGNASPEHVHQARVGLRRLRTALRVFGAWSGDVQPHWSAQAAALFTRLGAARDRDVLLTALLPQLRLAGAPVGLLQGDAVSDAAGTIEANDASAALREPETANLWLDLRSFAQAAPVACDPAGPSTLSKLALPLIERLQRRLLVYASNFAALDEAQRHGTRKRLKRLRYALEFVGSLCRRKALRRGLKRLQAAQVALGDYNDLVVAADACRTWAERDPRAWFAVGWCVARRGQALSLATRVLGTYRPVRRLPRSHK